MIVRRSNLGRATVLLGAALLLAGCSSSGMSEGLSPALGGLPTDAPVRPSAPGVFPAVHDMPPPRNDTPLTEEQQAKLERDLSVLRSRQEALGGRKEQPAKKPAAKPAAKPPISQEQ